MGAEVPWLPFPLFNELKKIFNFFTQAVDPVVSDQNDHPKKTLFFVFNILAIDQANGGSIRPGVAKFGCPWRDGQMGHKGVWFFLFFFKNLILGCLYNRIDQYLSGREKIFGNIAQETFSP